MKHITSFTFPRFNSWADHHLIYVLSPTKARSRRLEPVHEVWGDPAVWRGYEACGTRHLSIDEAASHNGKGTGIRAGGDQTGTGVGLASSTARHVPIPEWYDVEGVRNWEPIDLGLGWRGWRKRQSKLRFQGIDGGKVPGLIQEQPGQSFRFHSSSRPSAILSRCSFPNPRSDAFSYRLSLASLSALSFCWLLVRGFLEPGGSP